MIYQSFNYFTENSRPELKDFKEVFKKTNWLVVKETSKIKVKSKNFNKTPEGPIKTRKTEKNLRFFSPELSNQTALNPLYFKSKSEPNSKYKSSSQPSKKLSDIGNHHSSLVNHLKSLEKHIEIYETQNRSLKETLSNPSYSSKTLVESLKLESFELKTRLKNLKQLVIEDKAKINSLSSPETFRINITESGDSLKQMKSQVSRLTSKKSLKLSSWKSKIYETKEKISALTSEITSLSETLKQKQLTCRKMLVSINTEARQSRKSP